MTFFGSVQVAPRADSGPENPGEDPCCGAEPWECKGTWQHLSLYRSTRSPSHSCVTVSLSPP